jgi:hypothetical protein
MELAAGTWLEKVRWKEGVGSWMLYSGSLGMLRVPERMGGREGMIVISSLRYIRTELELKMAVQSLSQI